MHKSKGNEDVLSRCKSQLSTAVIADAIDSFGLLNQVLRPGLAALDPSQIPVNLDIYI